MNFADYNAFRVAVRTLMEGDDASQFTFSANTLDLIVGLGENRAYNGDESSSGLRASSMVAPLSAVVTANAAALPADLIELKEVYFSGKPPLGVIPLDRLRALEADGTNTGADVRYCAQDGDTLRFWPTASGTVLGSYYARPEPLATGTWADQSTFARYPEVFLFSALVESAPLIGEDARIPVWETKLRQAMHAAQTNERMRAYAGGPLRMRTR